MSSDLRIEKAKRRVDDSIHLCVSEIVKKRQANQTIRQTLTHRQRPTRMKLCSHGRSMQRHVVKRCHNSLLLHVRNKLNALFCILKDQRKQVLIPNIVMRPADELNVFLS